MVTWVAVNGGVPCHGGKVRGEGLWRGGRAGGQAGGRNGCAHCAPHLPPLPLPLLWLWSCLGWLWWGMWRASEQQRVAPRQRKQAPYAVLRTLVCLCVRVCVYVCVCMGGGLSVRFCVSPCRLTALNGCFLNLVVQTLYCILYFCCILVLYSYVCIHMAPVVHVQEDACMALQPASRLSPSCPLARPATHTSCGAVCTFTYLLVPGNVVLGYPAQVCWPGFGNGF